MNADLDAALARHVRFTVEGGRACGCKTPHCADCGKDDPCDAAQARARIAELEGQLAAVVEALRKGRQEMEWRLQDLLTCNKPDDCHTRALGADVAIADFDVATKALLSNLSTAAQQHDADVARAAVEAERERLRAGLEPETCHRCEGNGAMYADGKAHLYSEGAPTVRCGVCGGEGKVYPDVLALLTPTEVET